MGHTAYVQHLACVTLCSNSLGSVGCDVPTELTKRKGWTQDLTYTSSRQSSPLGGDWKTPFFSPENAARAVKVSVAVVLAAL
jgi:hypothetical protein